MTDKTAPKAPATTSPSEGGGLMSVLLVIVALVGIVGLYFLARMRTEAVGPQELPLISIQIEYDALTPRVREGISNLESALNRSGLVDTFGPSDQKILVPGATPDAPPALRAFDKISDDDWAKAWPYLTVGDWLVPRVFRIDGKACVVRVAPKSGLRAFADGVKALLEDAVTNTRGNESIKSVKVYSSPLGLGGAPERDALNVTFGVQTSWVKISRGVNASENDSNWLTVDGIKLLEKVKPTVTINGHIRTVTTPLSWLKYYQAVRAQKAADLALPTEVAEIRQAFDFAHANQIASHLDQSGNQALVAVTTDLEGRENIELPFYLASTLQDAIHVSVQGGIQNLPRGPAPASTPK